MISAVCLLFRPWTTVLLAVAAIANWLDPVGGDLAAHRFAALLDALTDFLRTEELVNTR